MTYETIDWPVEAKRIVAAFGLDANCQFREVTSFSNSQGRERELRRPYGSGSWGPLPALEREVYLKVHYFEGSRMFLVTNGNLWPDQKKDSLVEFDYSGKLVNHVSALTYNWLLARALFKLGLLSPEVEGTLSVVVSAHQKMEWSLEFEAYYGL